METKSIGRLLSLLELGGQTALVQIYPAGESSPNGVSGWPQDDFSGSPPVTPSWRAELYMQAGQLQYGAVYNTAGERKLVGEQALNFLGQMGGLSYELLPLPTRPALPPPADPFPHFPHQTTGHPGSYYPQELPDPRPPGDPSWFQPQPFSSADSWRPARTKWGELVAHNPQRLTRDQRRVLGLINGQRSVGELSRLLGFHPDALSEVLAFFREQNLIS